MMTVYSDAVCPFCGCLCDDIEITVEGNEIVNARNACAVSRAKFLNHRLNSLSAPTVDGEKVGIDEAVDTAARIIADARRPLIYGLSSTDCGAIGVAVELGELAGGVVDNTSSVCHGPTILALQQVGESKTTLGEVKNRADLIIFWGSNPTEAHLRHLIRYSVMPKGMYTQEGRKSRHVVVVDVRKTRTSRLADEFVKVDVNSDLELLLALRAVVRGSKIQAEEVSGVPLSQIKALAKRMKEARMGIVFFGLGLTHHTKFLLTPMRGHYNVAGANTVTTWQTGYPYAVDFSRGYPRYNPGEYTSVDLLARGEPDAAVIIASDPVAHFPASAAKHLARIPVVTLDHKVTPTTMLSKVVIPVATVGVEAEGTAYRMDGVPLRLKRVIEPHEGVLSDVDVLTKIVETVRSLKEGA